MANLYSAMRDSVREDVYRAVESCVTSGVSFDDMRRTVLQAWSDIWQEKAALAAKESANSWPK